MSKTVFAQGTYILANWLNSIFGGGAHKIWTANTTYAAGIVIKLSGGEILRAIVAGISGTEEPAAPGSLRGTVVDNTVTWELFAGHLHDARAMDGSAPKIHPISEIDGVSEGVFNLVFTTSFFTVEQVVPCYWKKVTSPLSGASSIVHLIIHGFYGTSNSVELYASGAIPEAIRPSGEAKTVIEVMDFDAHKLGMAQIESNGRITFFVLETITGNAESGIYTLPSAPFAASGLKGMYQDTLFTYPICP